MLIYLASPALVANGSGVIVKASVPQTVPAGLLTRLSEQKSLAKALNELAKHDRLTFLLEGNPGISPRHSIGEIIARTRKSPVSSRELLRQLADAYGYSVEESDGFVLLVQRYERSDRLPEVSIAEIRHFLSSVAKVANRFDPAFTRANGVDLEFRQFAYSLSPNIVAQWNRPSSTASTPRQDRIALLRQKKGISSANSTEGRSMPLDSPSAVPTSVFSPPQQQFLRNLGLEQFIGLSFLLR